MSYCIELKTGNTWAPKDIAHSKIPTEDKEELKKAEEKIREDLKEESQDTEVKTKNNSEEEQNINNSYLKYF